VTNEQLRRRAIYVARFSIFLCGAAAVFGVAAFAQGRPLTVAVDCTIILANIWVIWSCYQIARRFS
jgi:hypothetical protein